MTTVTWCAVSGDSVQTSHCASLHLVSGHPLLPANEVFKLDRIAHEERRRVVADQVAVSLVGV
jgi:hypothetical protein